MKSQLLYRLLLIAALISLAALFSACKLASLPTTTSLPPLPTELPTATVEVIPSPLPPLPGDDWAVPPIVIDSPGAGSTITSPVKISGVSDPVFEMTLNVMILDENGSVLFQEPVMIESDLGARGPFEIEAYFSVDHDQQGRVVVMEQSARDGGINTLASVEVTLLAGGTANIQPPTPVQPIVIDLPEGGVEISGGVLHIEGSSGPAWENTLGLVLCDENTTGDRNDLCGFSDAVLLQTYVKIDAPDIGLGGTFNADIPYTISTAQSVRIAVFTTSMRDGGVTQLVSRLVFLHP